MPLIKSRNELEPVSVTIEPMTPPVDLLRQTLNVQQAFGGVYLSWENAFGKEMAITSLKGVAIFGREKGLPIWRAYGMENDLYK
jgi:hypothetical protein